MEIKDIINELEKEIKILNEYFDSFKFNANFVLNHEENIKILVNKIQKITNIKFNIIDQLNSGNYNKILELIKKKI